MMKSEVTSSRLRRVVEYEVDFIRRACEKEIAERDIAISKKDIAIAEKDIAISKKDAEINFLKAKLKENGIE